MEMTFAEFAAALLPEALEAFLSTPLRIDDVTDKEAEALHDE